MSSARYILKFTLSSMQFYVRVNFEGTRSAAKAEAIRFANMLTAEYGCVVQFSVRKSRLQVDGSGNLIEEF